MPDSNSDKIYANIVSCMDELADSTGVSRCGLMYALANLVMTLKQKSDQEKADFQKKIEKLEEIIKAQSDEIDQLYGGSEAEQKG